MSDEFASDGGEGGVSASAEKSDERGKRPRYGSPALGWWKRLAHPLSGDPGTLARLRRARSPVEVLQIRAAVTLARQLGGAKQSVLDYRTQAALDLARVLAHVREHDPGTPAMVRMGWKTFAGDRRESESGSDRPELSEARFRRLLETGEGEEKVAAFIRLIALMKGKVCIDLLAKDFLLWNHPEYGDRIREQWAFQYYHAGFAAPAEPTPDLEDGGE